MKKLLVTVVVLAIVVLGSPAVIGKLAETAVNDSLSWSAGAVSDDGLTVETEAFESGWLTSNGTHRIRVSEAALSEALGDASPDWFGSGNAAAGPELLIETRLDHGLLPIGSLFGGGGSLMPGLGVAQSTVTLLYDGESMTLPGYIESHIGFGGTVSSRYDLAAGEYKDDGGGTLKWGASLFELAVNPASGAVVFDARGEGGAIVAGDMNASLGAWSTSSDQAPSAFGLYVGDSDLSVESFGLQETVGGNLSIGPLLIEQSARTIGDAIDSDTHLDMTIRGVDLVGDSRLVLDGSVRGIDGSGTAGFVAAMGAIDETLPPDAIYPMLRPHLEALFRRGFSVDIREFDLRFENGEIDSRLSIDVPPFEAGEFHWTAGVESAKAEAYIGIPAPIVDLALMHAQELNVLIAMGALKRSADDIYELEAAFEQGILTMNGMPMPVPLPRPAPTP